MITIKEYAVKNKLSIYKVVKAVKSGKLKSTTRLADGKDTVYVLDEIIQDTKSEIKVVSEPTDICKKLFDENHDLKNEIISLKNEIQKYKMSGVYI